MTGALSEHISRNGRFALDQPTTLPEGTVVDLVADDENGPEALKTLQDPLGVARLIQESPVDGGGSPYTAVP